MWNHKYLLRIDGKLMVLIACLMAISLLVISSMTMEISEHQETFFSPFVKGQIKWFALGTAVFIFFAGFDYRKLANWSYILYFIMILLLVGLYLTNPIQRVHRWYRIPLIGFNMQPSEFAKLTVVIFLGWFLDRAGTQVERASFAFKIAIIVGIPFFLILKQPDLGSALVLYPITLVMCYFAGVHPKVIKFMTVSGLVGLIFVSLIFTEVLSHQQMRPFFTSFMKEYQYERLNPNTYHQKAAQTAIAIGGMSGTGWQKSDFSAHKWLPASYTDSVFSAFSEEFGFLGVLVLLFLYYSLIYCCFQVVAVAKDRFGRLLGSGIAVYLAMHIIVNIGMMCGFLPISGVPLIMVTYGGSSVIITMAALGILQSIYTRRFMF